MKKKNGKKEVLNLLFWNILSKVVTYFLLLVLGNLYIISEYGKANFVLAIFNIACSITFLGIPNSIIPWIVKKEDYNNVLRVLFLLSIAIGVFLISISYIFISVAHYNHNNFYLIMPMGLAILILFINNVSASFTIARKRYDLVTFVGFLSILITLIFALLLRSWGGFGIVISYIFGYLFSAIFLSILEWNNLLLIFKNFIIDLKVFKKYFLGGFIISLISLSFYFLSWADSTILGILSNLDAVGRYGISSSLVSIIILIPFSLSMFVITRMSEINNSKKSMDILKRVIRISYFFSLILAIMISAYGIFVIKIFFPKYIGIEKVVSILLIGAVFYSVYFLIYNYYIAKFKISRKFLPIIIAAVINIILDILLIPFFGLYGICIATILAHFSAFLLLSKDFFSYKKIFLMALFTLSVPLAYYSSWFGIFISLIMAEMLFITGLVEWEDIRIIEKEIRKIFLRPNTNL